MVGSESVTVGGEVAAGVTDLVVVPKARRKREQPQRDAGPEAGQGAGTVSLEAELALAGPKHRLDPLAHGSQRSEAGPLVLSVGTQEAGATVGHEALKLRARKALVGDDRVAPKRHPLEHLLGDLAL